MDINNVGRFSCRYCNRYYSEKRLLERHISLNHSELVRNAVEIIDVVDINPVVHEDNDNNIEPDIEVDADDMVEEIIGCGQPRFAVGAHKNFEGSTPEHDYVKLMIEFLSKPEIPRKYVLDITNRFCKLLGSSDFSEQTECKIKRLLINMNLDVRADIQSSFLCNMNLL